MKRYLLLSHLLLLVLLGFSYNVNANAKVTPQEKVVARFLNLMVKHGAEDNTHSIFSPFVSVKEVRERGFDPKKFTINTYSFDKFEFLEKSENTFKVKVIHLKKKWAHTLEFKTVKNGEKYLLVPSEIDTSDPKDFYLDPWFKVVKLWERLP